ncbi:MAG: endonuclease/exonuclease/phosphatase family protein [Spirochaetales bacterium]|nr:endonuclease/exonuclease/phosphatase family protein [Spirochaetales bacterium]
MVKIKIIFFFIVMILILSGCEISESKTSTEYDNLLEEEAHILQQESGNRNSLIPEAVSVMTRNIYMGTDLNIITTGDPSIPLPVKVAQAFALFQATNFPERVISLAREIALTKPHLISLQEVITVFTQSPSDSVFGGTTPATDVMIDYLDVLLQTLASFGLNYRVAGKIANSDFEAPMITNPDPMEFMDIRILEYDVILAKNNVETSRVLESNYQVALPVPGFNFEVIRGYVAVDAKIGNKKYRYVCTHLESAPIDAIRLAQAQELVTVLKDETLPVILTGDFNTIAESGATYQYLLSEGYIDTWSENLFNLLNINPEGLTFGHDADLLNEEINFDRRIDYIFLKNNPLPGKTGLVFALTIGDEQWNRTPSGLWPSDHAGIAARLYIPGSK